MEGLIGGETVVLHSLGSRGLLPAWLPLAGLGELRAAPDMVISVLLVQGSSRPAPQVWSLLPTFGHLN